MLNLRLVMAKLVNELSVFFPAYNEEGNIEKTVLDAKKILQRISSKWEIIIVDDSSKDKTGKIADNLAKSDRRIKAVHHFPNRGYGGALKTGYKTAKYEWVAFTDSDGQFDFAEITKFLKYKNKADLILGYRLKRADPFVRKVFTWGWTMIPRIFFGLNIKDYSCGFWLIKKEVYDSIRPLVGEEKVTKIEILVKAKRRGYKISEVGVHHYPRKFGKQTGANIKVVVKSVIDLLKLWILLERQK